MKRVAPSLRSNAAQKLSTVMLAPVKSILMPPALGTATPSLANQAGFEVHIQPVQSDKVAKDRVISQNPGMPFGGRGASGYGRKHGDEGLLEFGFPHSISVKTGPAERPSTTFERPAGAVKAGLAAISRSILAGPSA